MVISVNDEHSLKAKSLIEVTDEGIDIWINDKHLVKVPYSIEVTEGGITICVNDAQSINASSPISFTEGDIECLDVMDAVQIKLFYMLSNHKKGNLVLNQAILITHGKITVNLMWKLISFQFRRPIHFTWWHKNENSHFYSWSSSSSRWCFRNFILTLLQGHIWFSHTFFKKIINLVSQKVCLNHYIHTKSSLCCSTVL